ncbi:Sulfite oxidase [Escovopsis weberi]|uniref:Nitrate reductase [NADPH] n=1 Tax=Escovopsis weberi TaxID=150374 RepID=A0A0M8NAE7_ESCWE|nr:Sulfite oxidase [Escovopsis weberi]
MASPTLNLLARQLRPRSHACLRPTLPLPLPRPPCRAFSKPSAPRGRPHASHPGPGPREDALRRPVPRAAALLSSLGLLAFLANLTSPAPHSFLDATSSSLSYPERALVIDHDGRDSSYPRYRISEIRKHDASSDQPWVMYGDKVYDITDWVSAHPGGQVILRAAGGSIEPYWDIFTIHKAQYVRDILEQYLIGYVHGDDLVDGRPARESIEDPFADDPRRDPALITLTSKPRNAETPAEALASSFLTPNELFYVRNHMWVPKMTDDEAEAHVLTVELLDGETREYTLRDLKTRFPRRSVTAALQCSGNRRSHMSRDSGRTANGLPWAAGAISNATWEGVYLADVLADAGLDAPAALAGSGDEKHVHFAGLEAYAASIPIRKAVDPQGDVLLAYGMNGKPLPRDHGFPLRSVVPGTVAARSVKWLDRITLSDEESPSQWQRRDYKCFGPNQLAVDWDAAPSIQEMPVQSAITLVSLGEWRGTKGRDENAGEAGGSGPSPESNHGSGPQKSNRTPTAEEVSPARALSLSGYAISGGGREIIRVDVSTDNGRTWAQARLLPDCVSRNGEPSPCRGHGAWAWKRWRFDGSLPEEAFTEAEPQSQSQSQSQNQGLPGQGKRCTTLVVKATDEVYNTQPERQGSIWNVRGNLATAWHRVQVCSDCAPGNAQTSAPRGGDENKS